jgi:hypothetical protein
MELLKVRVKQAEIEQKRIEAEKQKLVEQEMSYKKLLLSESLMDKIEIELKNFEKSSVLDSIVALGPKCLEVPEASEKLLFVCLTRAEQNLGADQTKAGVQTSFVLEDTLPNDILEVFTEWSKRNASNLFDNIRQEHNYKLKQMEANKNERNSEIMNAAKSSKKPLPESLLLKNSNKKGLDDIDTLHFHALTSYSLSTFELCVNLTVLTITNSQITTLDGLYNCSNLKYIVAQV